MKKLITIIASALTLGAFAGQENVPVAFDTSSVPVGTEVNVEADGVVFATARTTGPKLFALLPDGATSCGVKLAGEVNNTVIDTDFTAATACPIGWTALSYRASEGRTVTFNTTGATATNWDQASIYTDCSITPDVETTIDVVTSATGSNNNLVLYLASSEYSVLIGNSYNDDATKKVRIGEYDGDATAKFASFQSADGRAVPASSTVIAETADIDVGKPLSYHLVISGTTITGTVTGTKTASDPAESVTKEISFTLPTEYSFTKFGIDIDGKSSVSVQSVTIKNDQEPPAVRTVAVKDWTFEAFTYDGEDTELGANDIVLIPSTLANNNAQWQSQDLCAKLSGHAIIIEKEMNWKAPVGRMTINDVQAYLYQSQYSKILSGAVVDGTGTLRCSENNIPVEGPATISCAIADAGSFKLLDGATLTVATKLADGRVVTDVAKRRVAFNESTLTYSLIEQVTLSIPVIENAKAQYRLASETDWTDVTVIDGDHYKITVDKSVGFFFQYVALDGYTISGNQSGYKYSSGLSSDTTYDNSKNDLKVSANVTPEDVEAAVEDISAAIVDLINGAESAKVTIPTGVTITITGAATLEGLAESESKTTVVGDGTEKTVTRPAIESTTAGFYKVEATTAK